ncbi:chemotaxis protein CheB [Larkinella knui]|uniref:protein-glutamate methylesterase n=1 Tax=Larkinella knui TaxID=2025310 RepID=A0A3P1CQ79_9BACT|nr:chemotaxis protein CheB [Larkinella knui]RRB15409.1 chemotaxis protein CheB [Larkinella knui]
MTGCKVVAIGGSAGSIPVVAELLQALPANFQFTVIIILHRLKNVSSSMDTILAGKRSGIMIAEPDDKEVIEGNRVYLAPQNYHLLIEADKTISLDYSEPVHYSRPSIDVTFESVAQAYADKAVAVLLSGANPDGADGLLAIVSQGGMAIVQDPATAEYPAMPQAAIDRNRDVVILTPETIASFLHTLND